MRTIRPWPRLLVYSVAGAAAVVVANAILLHLADPTTRQLVMTLGQPLWSALATIGLCLAACCSVRSARQVRLAWGALAAAQLAVTCGGLMVVAVVLGWSAPAWLLHSFYLSFYPLLLFGVLSLPAQRMTWAAWWKMALDMAIVFLSTSLLLWHYWHGPLVTSLGGESLSVQLLALAYPVGDLVLLWVLLLLLYRQPAAQTVTALHLLAFGVGMAIVSDFNYGYNSVLGSYAIGGWLDLGWVMSSLSLGVAGICQATSRRPVPIQATSIDIPAYLNSWLTYLPYGWAIATYLLLQMSETSQELRRVTGLEWGVGFMMGLVLVRQMITLRENHLQTKTMQQTNHTLQEEIEERKRGKDALRLSEQRLRQVIDLVPHMIFAKDLEGRFVLANRAFADLFATTVPNVLGKMDLDFVHSAAEVAAYRADDYDVIRTGQVKHLAEEPFTDRQGVVRILQTTKIPFTFSGTTVPAVLGVASDITEQKRTMEALRLSEMRQQALLSAIPDRMFRVSRTGTILDCSEPRGGSIPTQGGWIGTDIREHLFLDQNAEETLAYFERALTNGEMQTQEYTFTTPDGPRSYESRIVGSGPDEIVCIVRDITDRKQAEARLAHDAVHDALTGLPNRVLYMERLRYALELARRHAEYHFGILFLDVDRFKVINDSLGHLIGDQLLIALAQRLRLCLYTGDTVARLGGDEFVILLDDLQDGNDAVTTAKRIQAALQQPFHLDGHQLFAAVSIGIVAHAEGYAEPEDALRAADIALYQAKLRGKGRYALFDSRMGEQAQSRLELESDLRQVLERRELELVYQPILTLQSDRIVGFEALLRWRHPRRGLVAPNEFIPIAEETGLIVSIGQWVLIEACRQLCAWQTEFPQTPPLTMSVNISAVQFAAPEFIGQVKEILQTVGLDPTTLRLELTESVWLNSSSAAIGLFRQLSNMGIQLHIDDFGTGYSSLAYLHHFPIRMIKIDRAFLCKMDHDGGNKDIVRAVIALAHDLGMQAVAEGVETVEQLENLKQLGCDYGQGYLLSRPISRAEIEQLLTKTNRPPDLAPAPIVALALVDDQPLKRLAAANYALEAV